MRNDEARPALPQPRHRLLDHDLGSRVDAAGGLVKDEDSRIAEEGASDGQQLFLPGRDVRGIIGQHRVVSLGQRPDELVHVGGLRGRHDLLVGRPNFSIADVLSDRTGEEPGVLEHHAEDASHVVAVEVAGIDAIEADPALVDVVEAHQQVDDGRLARPGRPDDRDRLPWPHLEIEIGDERLLRLVAE